MLVIVLSINGVGVNGVTVKAVLVLLKGVGLPSLGVDPNELRLLLNPFRDKLGNSKNPFGLVKPELI